MISEGTIETIVEGHLINEIKVAVLNNGNFIAFHLESCTFRYNNEDMYRKIKSNIEKYSQIFERNEELEGYKVDDVKIGQDFVILKFQKALLSFRFKEDPEENDFIYDFKKLKVPIATYYEGVSLNDIIITSHPTKILLNYTFELRGRNMKKNNIIIWDIDTDEEFSSFTPRDNDVFLFYLYCPIRQVRESIAYHASQGKKGTGKKSNNEQKEPRKEIYEVWDNKNSENPENFNNNKKRISQTGYLVFNEYYVNLDTMLPSPVMKFDGEKLERNQYQFGPKMNHNESFAIINGFLVTTYSYLDIELRQKRKKFEGMSVIFMNRESHDL